MGFRRALIAWECSQNTTGLLLKGTAAGGFQGAPTPSDPSLRQENWGAAHCLCLPHSPCCVLIQDLGSWLSRWLHAGSLVLWTKEKHWQAKAERRDWWLLSSSNPVRRVSFSQRPKLLWGSPHSSSFILYLAYEKILFILYNLFIWKAKGDKVREIFHLLVHYSNGHNSQVWSGPKLGARTISWSPVWVAGLKYLTHLPLSFLNASAGMISRETGTQTRYYNIECQFCET